MIFLELRRHSRVTTGISATQSACWRRRRLFHLPRQVFQLLPNTCCTRLRRQQSCLGFFIQTLLTSGRRRRDQRGCGPLVGVGPGGSSGSAFPFPWKRKWQPTPVFLPGEFHGQKSLVGYSPCGHKELDMTEQLSTHHSGAFLLSFCLLFQKTF